MISRSRIPLACRAFLAIFAGLSAAGCTFFPDPPPGWEGKYSADVALERAIATGASSEGEPLGGGIDLISRATLVRYEGEETARLAYRVLWKGNSMWSIEMEDEAGETVRVVKNGDRMVEIKNDEVARLEVPPAEAGIDRYLHYLFPCQFFLQGAGSDPKIEGTIQRSDGGYSIRIGKYRPSGHKIVISLDSETLRPLAMREWQRLDVGSYLPLDTYFDEFVTDRRGNLFPRVMRTYVEGELIQEMRIEEVAWNQGLRDIDFQVAEIG